jgi:hypothetical protein
MLAPLPLVEAPATNGAGNPGEESGAISSFFAIFARSPDWSSASSPNSSARILEQVD